MAIPAVSRAAHCDRSIFVHPLQASICFHLAVLFCLPCCIHPKAKAIDHSMQCLSVLVDARHSKYCVHTEVSKKKSRDRSGLNLRNLTYPVDTYIPEIPFGTTPLLIPAQNFLSIVHYALSNPSLDLSSYIFRSCFYYNYASFSRKIDLCFSCDLGLW